MFFFLLQSINAFQNTFQSSASSNWTLKLELDKPATKIQVSKQLSETLPKKQRTRGRRVECFCQIYYKTIKNAVAKYLKETDPKLSNATKIMTSIANTNANINKFRVGISKCESYINQLYRK